MVTVPKSRGRCSNDCSQTCEHIGLYCFERVQGLLPPHVQSTVDNLLRVSQTKIEQYKYCRSALLPLTALSASHHAQLYGSHFSFKRLVTEGPDSAFLRVQLLVVQLPTHQTGVCPRATTKRSTIVESCCSSSCSALLPRAAAPMDLEIRRRVV